VYEFFNRHAGVKTANPEDELIVEDREFLQCSPTGQVSDMSGRRW
jgi:hypothetical protein